MLLLVQISKNLISCRRLLEMYCPSYISDINKLSQNMNIALNYL